MANLDYESFTESIRTVLKLRNSQDDAIVKEITQAAVRDLIEEFDSDVGSRTDFTLKVTQEQLDGVKWVSRIYLPNDALYVRQIYVGSTLVEPINMLDAEFWGNHSIYISNLIGVHAFVGRNESGKMYIQFASLLESDYIRVDYRIHSSDITYIPEAYKNLVLYASICHYRNWYMTDDVAAQSKAKDNYREYLARMRADTANQDLNQKRPYEVEWKNMFRFVLESNINSIAIL